MATYRDNYPHNIEAPQRVYVQYSQDITFDYSGGKYPLGETYEGFVWEYVYVPVEHIYGTLTLGRHVWMRWRIGEREEWTLPMRITDSFLNIQTTELEEIPGTEQVRFRFKYTLNSGTIVYSEYMVLTNGIDGRGIESSEILDNNLVFTYTDGTTQDVGRVVGYDGLGVPVGGNEDEVLTYISGEPQWRPTSHIFEDLSAILPIIFDVDEISHSNEDGYRHIPIGGTSGQCLSTNGSGTYSWLSVITEIPIDDFAGIGDTDKLWSADKISIMFANMQTAGIKYSVSLITDLGTIIGMDINDLAVVDEDRYVYQYDGANWNQFFALDAAHNHDDRYFTEIELTNGTGVVHWDNLTNIPDLSSSWNVQVGLTTQEILNEDTLIFSVTGNAGITFINDTINIDVPVYTAGNGILIWDDTQIHHADTSSVANSLNGGVDGNAIKNLTFDTFGHVLTHSSYNFDNRYALLNHTHSQFTQYPTVWTTITLLNGWTAYSGTNDRLRYRMDSPNVVRIIGVLRAPAGGNVAQNVGQLPVGYAPITNIFFSVRPHSTGNLAFFIDTANRLIQSFSDFSGGIAYINITFSIT